MLNQAQIPVQHQQKRVKLLNQIRAKLDLDGLCSHAWVAVIAEGDILTMNSQ
jgi:hypothetical protein